MTRKQIKRSEQMIFGHNRSKGRHGHIQKQTNTAKEDDFVVRMNTINAHRCFICLENPGRKMKNGRYVCQRCQKEWGYRDI